jgi:triosephosphate isomerase
MAMTISEGLAFVQQFRVEVETLAHSVQIVLCPPYTSLYALSQVLRASPIDIGAQDLCAAPGDAYTGEISAPMLADAGCTWVMLGHWEIRHRTGETDLDVNRKMHAAIQVGLRPILMIGETRAERGYAEEALAARLPDLFANSEAGQVARAAVVYEPEWSIGIEEPAPPDYIGAGCAFIRNWIGKEYGPGVANEVRLIYGGSVAPEHAERLLASPDLDGLGAGRKGRDPAAFAQIVKMIAAAKGVSLR